MKRIVLAVLVVGLFIWNSCASTSPKLFTEIKHHYDGIGDEYRMSITGDDTARVSICFFENEIQSRFVLRFERTIKYSEIDSSIATLNALGTKTTRKDHLLTGKVDIKDYGLRTRFTLEAGSNGVSRIPASSYVKEFFVVLIDEETLKNIFSEDTKNIIFYLRGETPSLVGIPSEKYENTKTKVFQFYEKHKSKIQQTKNDA